MIYKYIMNKNLIIIKDKKKINKKSFPFFENEKDFLLYDGKIYLLYDVKTIINPPFFEKIIIIRDDLLKEDIHMIINMLYINGILYFPHKYLSYIDCKKGGLSTEEKINLSYYYCKKLNNSIYRINYNRVVDFIIMGVQKGGTTALSANIGKHPDIYIDTNIDPRKSEIHFFTIYWKNGIDWYKKKFDYSKKLVGEKTPDLIYLDYTFPYIQFINPFLKIILILRDPIERAYSSWKTMKSFNYTEKSFEESIKDELNGKLSKNINFYTSNYYFLEKGLYFKQISKLLKWFPMQNVLILISEDVKKNMVNEYNKVYKFLNLDPIMRNNYKLEFISEDKSKIDTKLYNGLIPYYKKDVNELEKLLNIKLNWLKKR